MCSWHDHLAERLLPLHQTELAPQARPLIG
jgi:hypothetical protein